MSDLTEKEIIKLFDEAPEGCLGAVKLKEENNDEFGIFVTKTKGFMNDNYHYCGHTDVGPVMDAYDFIPKPDSFIDKSNKVYTQAMEDNGELLTVGMMFNHKGKEVKALAISKEDGGSVLFQTDGNNIDCCWNNDAWVKPIDTRTDEQKAQEQILYAWNNRNGSFSVLDAIKAGKIHNVTWSK